MTWLWVILLVVLIAFVVLYLSMTAGRLDRLHQRVDTALLTLQTHLLRRSATTLDLATIGVLDPATSVVLAEQAHEARLASESGDLSAWQVVESELTAALLLAFDEDTPDDLLDDPEKELLNELRQACRRVELSRRFYNDAVRACRQVRGRTIVRTFRLAGRTGLPHMWEMADEVPIGLR
jgi:hypothetical protein